MTDNTQRFTGRAAVYDRYRQRYPNEAVLEQLREWCGLTPDWAVTDVGAGTGMLSEVFIANGNRVIAIEPNEEMRSVCSQLTSPLIEIVDATAENTGLADHSVEMVAAGRAFHWFDTERALAEFRRILKPGGWVALVSSGRAPATEKSVAFERLLQEFSTDDSYSRDRYRVHDKLEGLFPELHLAQVPGEQQLHWNDLLGFAQSLSIVPQAGSPQHAPFEAALRRYFDTFAAEGVLTIETACWISAGRW